MTISSSVRKVGPFTGTGTVTVFTFDFKVFQRSDLYVVKADSDGIETVLVLNTDYTASLNSNQDSNPGGSITLASALASGYTMIISSTVGNLQPTDLTNQGGFYPSVITDALDRATIQIQQLQEQVDRSAKLPITNDTDADELLADILLLANNKAELDVLYANINDIQTVAADLNEPVSEINTVAGSIDNVNTVGGNITNVNTVAGNTTNINTVAGNTANVTTVAGISGNVTTVAGISANVTAVANNATNINAVNANKANIDAVAGNNTNITAVAGNATNINAVNANKTNIDTVAGKATEVTTVAGIAGNVTTVAGISANVTAVANNSTNINAVAGNATNINAVNANKANIDTVAGDKVNIDAVAGDKANIDAVAGDLTNINAVNANKANIDTVAGISSNVTTVAGISASVVTASNNVTAINDYSKVWLGGKASDPTLRNDGSALQTGDQYFNTGTNKVRVYSTGTSVWVDSGITFSPTVERFSGTGSQTAFTLSSSPGTAMALIINISGVVQTPTVDYTVSGTTLTFTTAPPSGTNNITVQNFGSAGVINVPADGSVTTSKIVDGSVTAAKLADGSVTNAKLAFDGGAFGFRNRIINGAMTVAQRGTSGTNGGYSLDRWIVAAAGTVGTWSQATGTFVNNQTGNFLQINGAAGNTFVVPVQRIESLNSRDLAGQTATVSYELYQNTGSAMSVTTSLFYANSTDNFSSSTLIANSSVQSVASGVVTKVTATFSIPSAATTGIEVRPCSQLQALGAGQAIQIGNVQLEKGSVATPFEFRPYGTELALCQRYYYASAPGSIYMAGFAYGANSVDGLRQPYGLPVIMRATPTASTFGGDDGGSVATLQVIAATASTIVLNLRSNNSDNSVWWAGGNLIANAEL